ncbi:MAG: OmpA family protein, partial [Candidatus Methylomirabilota bacterium]
MQERFSVRILFTVGVLVGSLALMGCPKRPEVAQAGPGAVGPGAAAPGAPGAPSARPGETPVTRPAPPTETPVRPSPSAQAVPGVPAGSPMKDVFFDFDKANIRDDQKAALNDNVAWLKSNTRAKAAIEGHCDERGTAEYNLGLGERRAKAVKDYLVAAGIGADR